MFVVIGSGVVVVALFVALAVVTKRRHGPPIVQKPDPQPVDRVFDPELCTYCDEAGKFACVACSRKLCAMHKPWIAGRFCYACEATWKQGDRKRSIVLVPIVIAAMIGAAGAMAAMSAITGYAALGAVILPFVIAAPVYLGIERRMRRRFKPTGNLPSAKVQRS